MPIYPDIRRKPKSHKENTTITFNLDDPEQQAIVDLFLAADNKAHVMKELMIRGLIGLRSDMERLNQ